MTAPARLAVVPPRPASDDGLPSPSVPAADASSALAAVVAELPRGGEVRHGQDEMARAIAEAVEAGRHLVVRAGTGTGKTLGYLVPAVLSGKRTVVATATRALQDQLGAKDLPFLEQTLAHPFTWAVLKGRSNYVCVQRLAEVAPRPVAADEDGSAEATTAGQLALDGLAERADPEELAAIASWAATTTTGDRAELDVEPSDSAWAAVSTTSRDCPGAARCPRGDRCFTEAARERAAQADVVVVNLHLYGLDLASDGAILPEHDLTVIDEAHVVDDIISATTGVEIGAGRFTHLARLLRGILAEAGDTITGVADSGPVLSSALVPHRDQRLTAPLPDALTGALAAVRRRVEAAQTALRGIPDGVGDDVQARAIRARQAATALLDEIDAVSAPTDAHVLFVTGPDHAPALRLAPLDVAGLLRERLWSRRTAVLTSATLAPGFGPHLGLPQRADELLDVGSPFDYPANGLIYCAARLPRPTDPRWPDLAIDELAALIDAAGGRTLALFTSYKAMDRAVDALRERLPFPLHRPGPAAQAGADRAVRPRPRDLPVRHHELLAGHRRPRPVAVAGHDRPPAVPPARRPAAPGPARARGRRGVPRHRRAAGVHAAGPGRRVASSARRPTGGRWPCSIPGWRRPATAPRSSPRSPACAARATGPRSRRSCASCARPAPPPPDHRRLWRPRSGPSVRSGPVRSARQKPRRSRAPSRRCQSLSTLTCSSR